LGVIHAAADVVINVVVNVVCKARPEPCIIGLFRAAFVLWLDVGLSVWMCGCVGMRGGENDACRIKGQRVGGCVGECVFMCVCVCVCMVGRETDVCCIKW